MTWTNQRFSSSKTKSPEPIASCGSTLSASNSCWPRPKWAFTSRCISVAWAWCCLRVVCFILCFCRRRCVGFLRRCVWRCLVWNYLCVLKTSSRSCQLVLVRRISIGLGRMVILLHWRSWKLRLKRNTGLVRRPAICMVSVYWVSAIIRA